MKMLAIVFAAMLAAPAVAAMAKPPTAPILINGKAVTYRGSAKVAEHAAPTPVEKTSGASVADLESKLRTAASYAQMAEFKAKLQDEENDLSWRTLGHGTETDSDAYGEAYKRSYEEGEAACNAWVIGKPAKLKAAAKVYCSIWKSTLVANAEASARHEDFASTPAGAQFVRAQAEFEAAAEE